MPMVNKKTSSKFNTSIKSKNQYKRKKDDFTPVEMNKLNNIISTHIEKSLPLDIDQFKSKIMSQTLEYFPSRTQLDALIETIDTKKNLITEKITNLQNQLSLLPKESEEYTRNEVLINNLNKLNKNLEYLRNTISVRKQTINDMSKIVSDELLINQIDNLWGTFETEYSHALPIKEGIITLPKSGELKKQFSNIIHIISKTLKNIIISVAQGERNITDTSFKPIKDLFISLKEKGIQLPLFEEGIENILSNFRKVAIEEF